MDEDSPPELEALLPGYEEWPHAPAPVKLILPRAEALLPGYEEWPHGYTIGPDERGKGRTPTERAKHLLAELPLLEELGLITPTVRQLYESDLRRGDLEAIVKRAERDLWSERISSEVFALIQALK